MRAGCWSRGLLMMACALAWAGPVGAADTQANSASAPPGWTVPLERDHPLTGTVWLPATGETITPAALVERLAAAEFVLLGEKHDNPDHHRLQAWLIERLAASGRHPAVAFEMIDSDKAPVLSAWLAAHPGDAAGLGPALAWDKSGWPDWDGNYRPVAAAALAAGLPLAAANLPTRQVMALAHGDGPPAAELARLGIDQPLPPAMEKTLAEDIRDSHCKQMPEVMVPGMMRGQRARDAAMAQALVAAAAGPGADGAVLIAGAGHVRQDRAVPLTLRQLAPGRTVFALALLEVSAEDRKATDYADAFDGLRGPRVASPFDAIWFTARLDNDDPCQAFADQLKKAREKALKTDKP